MIWLLPWLNSASGDLQGVCKTGNAECSAKKWNKCVWKTCKRIWEEKLAPAIQQILFPRETDRLFIFEMINTKTKPKQTHIFSKNLGIFVQNLTLLWILQSWLAVFAREGSSPGEEKFPSGLVTVTAKLYMGNSPSLHMSHSSKGKEVSYFNFSPCILLQSFSI